MNSPILQYLSLALVHFLFALLSLVSFLLIFINWKPNESSKAQIQKHREKTQETYRINLLKSLKENFTAPEPSSIEIWRSLPPLGIDAKNHVESPLLVTTGNLFEAADFLRGDAIASGLTLVPCVSFNICLDGDLPWEDHEAVTRWSADAIIGLSAEIGAPQSAIRISSLAAGSIKILFEVLDCQANRVVESRIRNVELSLRNFMGFELKSTFVTAQNLALPSQGHNSSAFTVFIRTLSLRDKDLRSEIEYNERRTGDNLLQLYQESVIFCQRKLERYPNLSLDELIAIRLFTHDSVIRREINFALRELDPGRGGHWRTFIFTLARALSLLPRKSVVLYRGWTSSASHYTVGKRLIWKQFHICTSIAQVAEDLAGEGGVVCCVTEAEGCDLNDLSVHPHQHEWMLPPFTALTVKARESDGTRTRCTLSATMLPAPDNNRILIVHGATPGLVLKLEGIAVTLVPIINGRADLTAFPSSKYQCAILDADVCLTNFPLTLSNGEMNPESVVVDVPRKVAQVFTPATAAATRQEQTCLAGGGVSVVVPIETVDAMQEFSITPVPATVGENANTIFTSAGNVVSLLPNDVELRRPVKVTFPGGGDEDSSIFVQGPDAHSQALNSWLRMPGKRNAAGEGTVSVLARELGYMFASAEMSHLRGLVAGHDSPDTVRAGLNYRAFCWQCHKFSTTNRGFLGEHDPRTDAPQSCPTCHTEIPTVQIIFCDTTFAIKYKCAAQLGLVEATAPGDDLFIVGFPSEGKFQEYFVTTRPSLLNPLASRSNADQDAAKDGAFLGKTVLAFVNPDVAPTFMETGGGAMLTKGFKVRMVSNESTFATQLVEYDIGWVVSGSALLQPGCEGILVSACRSHLQAGKGLYIWGDNEPFFVQANIILKALFNFELAGNTAADKVLAPGYSLARGTFLANHLITTGVPALYEGVTICYPTQVPPEFHVLAESTDGHPCILYREAQAGCGRVVLDCGWTKLYGFLWTRTTGTARYVANAACWLAGFSLPSQAYLLPDDKMDGGIYDVVN